MPGTTEKKCAGCGNSIGETEGVPLWDTWFCSMCFISHAAKLNQQWTPEQIALLRRIGKELAGFMPPELVEMIAVGFYRRITGRRDEPDAEEVSRFVGELQRLAALCYFRREMNLLETWFTEFKMFVEGRTEEIRGTIRRLTEGG